MNGRRSRWYRMADDGRLSSGSDDIEDIKRLRESQRQTGYESPYTHLVEFAAFDQPTEFESGIKVIGMMFEVPWDHVPPRRRSKS